MFDLEDFYVPFWYKKIQIKRKLNKNLLFFKSNNLSTVKTETVAYSCC